MNISIKYCVQWNYKPEALRVRSLLLEYEKIEVILLEGAGGVFEISKPDKMIFSKKLSGRFPTETEVRAMAKEV